MSGIDLSKVLMSECVTDQSASHDLNKTRAHIVALRQNMTTSGWIKELADQMVRSRPAPGRERLMRLADAYGIDGLMTLAELGIGKTGDLPPSAEARALLHVPLGRWNEADVLEMLSTGLGVDFALWLAVDALEQDPFFEAKHFEGDLLLQTARCVSCPSHQSVASLPQLRTRLSAILDHAQETIKAIFQGQTGFEYFTEIQQAAIWGSLVDGRPQGNHEMFHPLTEWLNVVAEARDLLDPPIVLAKATATMTYAHDRLASGLRLVGQKQRVSNGAVAIEDTSVSLREKRTFTFDRRTHFEIAVVKSDGNGSVRLRHFSQAALENHLGVRFHTMSDARQYASENFGLADDAWAVEDGVSQ